jgi:hypothetical protein
LMRCQPALDFDPIYCHSMSVYYSFGDLPELSS